MKPASTNSQTVRAFPAPKYIPQKAPFSDEADRLIDMDQLLKKPKTPAEAKKRDDQLRIWRHQAELRGSLITPDSVADWQSWMFGTLLELRKFIATTKAEDRCQCKSKVLLRPEDHWPECINGEILRCSLMEDAYQAMLRKKSSQITIDMRDQDLMATLTDEEVRGVLRLITFEIARRQI